MSELLNIREVPRGKLVKIKQGAGDTNSDHAPPKTLELTRIQLPPLSLKFRLASTNGRPGKAVEVGEEKKRKDWRP